MNNTIKTILGVGLSILLVCVLVFEFNLFFNLVEDRNDEIYSVNRVAKADAAKASVSIDKPYTFEEIIYPVENGDIIKVDGLDLNIKLNGYLTDDSDTYAGQYKYADDSKQANNLYVENKVSNLSKYTEGVLSYWSLGTSDNLMNALGYNYQPDNITCYQQSYKDGNIPVLFNSGTNLYYMFIEAPTSFYVLSCAQPFAVTDEMPTSKFKDPSIDVLRNHTYSKWEEMAAEATLKELEEAAKENSSSDNVTPDSNPYSSSDVAGTASTYTSTTDNNLRKQMVSYSDYTWGADGTADGTTLKIDTTGEEPIKSQWTLTVTTYKYTYSGLQLSDMNAKRGTQEFYVSGKITNLIATERPYVIVIKLLDTEGNLLGIKVLDNRATPLAASPNGSATFEASFLASTTNIKTENVTAVQFEIY